VLVRTHAFIVYRSLTKLNHVLQPCLLAAPRASILSKACGSKSSTQVSDPAPRLSPYLIHPAGTVHAVRRAIREDYCCTGVYLPIPQPFFREVQPMSAINGDKARFNRQRRQKIARRMRNRQMLKTLAEARKPAAPTSKASR